ncbi:geranylgeranyl pyrophosphate synthetase [Saxophila tyrrhenica]|uniref:Geranylgeranyl pyrophosphate synthetase n=1 Tax=Saxophila tyrrhenica TaxID=1690608 RepID=A0AAV9PA82_9PEZI|nr:geranylgeranyl pyrophosphate synthetase [Saxophila tyrrhenica]
MSKTTTAAGRIYLNGVDEEQADGKLNWDLSAWEPKSLTGVPRREPSTSSAKLEGGSSRTGEPPQRSPARSPGRPPGKAPSGSFGETGESRSSRFVEEMATDINAASAPPPAESSTGRRSNSVGSSVPPAMVNPATVPIRTSSKGMNGEASTSPKQSKSPRKHRSMASVPEEQRRGYPEVDERNWLAQGKNGGGRNGNGHTPTTSQSNTHGSSSAAIGSDNMLRGVGADLVSGMSSEWSTEKENILKGPFDYLESHPGKDIRTTLIAAFNNWLQVPSSSLRIITGVVTMLHTASLLIDDVEDSAQLRRGVPVAHQIFGTAQTINSANYVYFCALQELLKLNNPEAIRIYTDELLNLHRGQGMDLFWRDTLTCPSEDDYLEMVGNKTGGLFRLAIKLMCAESPTHNFNPSTSQNQNPTPTDYIPLVNTIGLLFQILDDYRNLSDPAYTSNKGLCEDLTEGKFSFPIIHAIRADPHNLVLINILKQKTQDDEVKRYAVSYMERMGSFGYTRRVLRGLTKKAVGLVEEVDGGRGCGGGIVEVLERMRVERKEEVGGKDGGRREGRGS